MKIHTIHDETLEIGDTKKSNHEKSTSDRDTDDQRGSADEREAEVNKADETIDTENVKFVS